MGSVNKVILVGNLGRDAELRYTPGGAPVATLNLATTEVWNDKAGQRQEKTEWHRVVLWGKTAESLNEYLVKGKQIYVEGRLQTRQWDDKDGNKRYTTEIRGDRIVLLGGGGGGGAGRPAGQRAPVPAHRAGPDGRAHGRARLRADRRRYSVLAGLFRFIRSSACRASVASVSGRRVVLDHGLERLARQVGLLQLLIGQPELVVGGGHAVALRVVGDHLLVAPGPPP